MLNKSFRRSINLVLIALLATVFSGILQAQVLNSTVNKETQINKNSAASQKRITGLAQQTTDLITEYRSVVRETESL